MEDHFTNGESCWRSDVFFAHNNSFTSEALVHTRGSDSWKVWFTLVTLIGRVYKRRSYKRSWVWFLMISCRLSNLLWNGVKWNSFKKMSFLFAKILEWWIRRTWGYRGEIFNCSTDNINVHKSKHVWLKVVWLDPEGDARLSVEVNM